MEIVLYDRVADMWNSLRDGIVEAPSMNAFKNRLDKAIQEHMFIPELPIAPYGPGQRLTKLR